MTSPDLPALIARVRELQAKADPPQTPGYVRVGQVDLTEWASVSDEILLLADECSRLQERVRVLEKALRVVYRGWHERSDEGEVSNWPMTDQAMAFARAALEGIEVE